MLISCCFAITVMVDTISFASSWSSFKFPLAIGIIHDVLLQHFDSYLDHAMLFPAQVWGGIHENFISTSSCALYIYVCVHLFLVDQFIPLIDFSLFVSKVYYINTLTTLYITTLHVMTAVMPVHALIHDDQLQACPCALLGLMYGIRRLYVIRYLRFQFVDDNIKGQALPFFLQFF